MRVLVLAGGFDQIELILQLKKRGNEVILADYLDNPPAKPYADKHCQVSTLDIEAIKKVALEEKVDLITTACTDQALLTAAKVSEEMGFPFYISYDKALKVTNKKYMKEIFQKNGIPTASCVTLDCKEEIWEKVKNLKYPFIVKPCDCNSSKGVKKVCNKEELEVCIDPAFLLSRTGNVIVEEFIEGKEISVDVWVENRETKILSVSMTEKIKDNKDVFTIYRSVYPVNLSKVANEKLKEIIGKIAATFELSNCPMLVQALVKDDEIFVIEFSARMGGGSKYKLIEYMSGVDIMETYVKRVLGEDIQKIEPIYSKKIVELDYVYGKPGIVKELIGFQECKENGEIQEYFQYKTENSKIEKVENSSDRIAGFLLIEDSIEDLNKKRNDVLAKIDVKNSDGQSMMIKSIYEMR